MRKILITALILLTTVTSTFALNISNSLSDRNDDYVVTQKEYQDAYNKISRIGFNLLDSNGIETRAVFLYNKSMVIDAYTTYHGRRIWINKGMYIMLNTDEEIAAVLAHEISHSQDSYNGILRGTFSFVNYLLSPKKYDYKADKRAVDYMVNAGYNPVALIITMNKIEPQYRYDFCSTHPLVTRRMMEVYEYIYKKYPEYLVNNPYKNNLYYQNFLLTSRQNRAKFQEKVKTNSNKKIRYK